MTPNPSRICCGNPVKSGKRADPGGSVVYAYWCESCGRKGSGSTPEMALVDFDAARSTALAPNKIAPNAPPRALRNPADLVACIADRGAEIAQIAAPFVKSDRPAFNAMVKKTTRYVMGLSGDNWNKVWATPEGRDSIIAAMEDAFQLGATLPDMGCMVPYGGIAEFIPDVEAYRFAVTTGASAPFESLEIEPIFANDKYHIGRKDGNFSIEFDSIMANRGEVIAIVVYGRHRSGQVRGEVYPVDRLIEKARVHSQSYRSYLQDVAAFESDRAEGKLKKAEGREYVEIEREYWDKEERKKKTYTKKAFRDELSNPYDGADRPEMLRKLAGKSFLAPYIKTRNSTAAIQELEETDDVSAMLDAAMDKAFDAMPADREPEYPPAAIAPEPVGAEPIPEAAPAPAKKPEPVAASRPTAAPPAAPEHEENDLF